MANAIEGQARGLFCQLKKNLSFDTGKWLRSEQSIPCVLWQSLIWSKKSSSKPWSTETKNIPWWKWTYTWGNGWQRYRIHASRLNHSLDKRTMRPTTSSCGRTDTWDAWRTAEGNHWVPSGCMDEWIDGLTQTISSTNSKPEDAYALLHPWLKSRGTFLYLHLDRSYRASTEFLAQNNRTSEITRAGWRGNG